MFNELLNSRSQQHNSPGAQTLDIQNDPSPILERSTNGRQTIARPAQAPSNSSAARHTCHLKNLRVSAPLRRTGFPPRTQLLRSQRCTLIHSLTYSPRDPSRHNSSGTQTSDFKTILIPFSDTSLCVATPRRRTESRAAANRARARRSPSRPPASTLALPGAQALQPTRQTSAPAVKPPLQNRSPIDKSP
jgi:hypothetical protein